MLPEMWRASFIIHYFDGDEAGHLLNIYLRLISSDNFWRAGKWRIHDVIQWRRRPSSFIESSFADGEARRFHWHLTDERHWMTSAFIEARISGENAHTISYRAPYDYTFAHHFHSRLPSSNMTCHIISMTIALFQLWNFLICGIFLQLKLI